MGILGGSPASFIGRVHILAAQLDGRARLTAGVFSSDAQRNRAAAEHWGVDPRRCYGDVEQLLAGEAALPAEQRIDFLTVATPNDLHFAGARAAIAAGLPVFCDKPMTIRLAEAAELRNAVRAAGVPLVVTHNYTGYPLIRLARRLIHDGELGEVQAVRASYLQGWMRTRRPGDSHPRGMWKFDPQRAGAGAFGDVGVHAFNLFRYVTGLLPEQLACHLRTFSPRGRLDDYGYALLPLVGGGLASITVSQVTHGRANDLVLEIDGRRGALRWRQEEPNQLEFRQNGQPVKLHTRDRNAVYAGPDLRDACRLPAGLPEGFIEAFANVYAAGFAAVDSSAGSTAASVAPDDRPVYPTVDDGWEGVQFIQACLTSASRGSDWVTLDAPEDSF